MPLTTSTREKNERVNRRGERVIITSKISYRRINGNHVKASRLLFSSRSISALQMPICTSDTNFNKNVNGRKNNKFLSENLEDKNKYTSTIQHNNTLQNSTLLTLLHTLFLCFCTFWSICSVLPSEVLLIAFCTKEF
jgi:hypothetical protein